MITLNLLPLELRPKESVSQGLPLVKIGVAAGVLFVLLTAFFYFDFLASSARMAKLKNQWEKIQPESVLLNQLRNEVEGILKPQKEFMRSYVVPSKPLTYLLMCINEFLPKTAWLTEVKLDHDDKGSHLLVKGLCMNARDKTAIEQIESYIQSMKGKLESTSLNLTTTRQNIKSIQLTQFVAVFTWASNTSPAKK